MIDKWPNPAKRSEVILPSPGSLASFIGVALFASTLTLAGLIHLVLRRRK